MKITAFRIYPVAYEITSYFKFFTTPLGHEDRPTVVLEVFTDDGFTGWGQSVPISTWSYETMESSIACLSRYLCPALIGADPTDIEEAHKIMDKVLGHGYSTGMPLTRAAIDLALHDLVGKSMNRPAIVDTSGEPSGKITLSWTVNATTIDGIEESLEKGSDEGYRHFNLKVGPDLQFDRSAIKTVRDFAQDCFLWVDANTGYQLQDAVKASVLFADYGVDIFESPIPPARITDYIELRRKSPVPIYMDEAVVDAVNLQEFHRIGMLDGLAMKPSRCGGLHSNRKMIETCRELDIPWAGSGLCDPDISLAASLILYNAYGLMIPAALNGKQFLEGSILSEPIQVSGGIAECPSRPGLGIDVDREKLAALSEQTIHNWRLDKRDLEVIG